MGSHMVVLNSSDAAADLLERRSVGSGDRVCKYFEMPFTTSALTGTYRQPRLPMANELYVSSYSSGATLTHSGFSQHGVHLVFPHDALREPLAYPPPVIPPLLQRFGRESVRRQDPQGSKRLPPSAL